MPQNAYKQLKLQEDRVLQRRLRISRINVLLSGWWGVGRRSALSFEVVSAYVCQSGALTRMTSTKTLFSLKFSDSYHY